MKGWCSMIVIGVDTHKGSHALAAVDEGTGRVRGSREIKADDAGHLTAVRWARAFDEERVWAIEDCRHVSRRLEQALLAAGERVIRVAPKMMGASRRGERERGKSDEIDAQAVARAVVKDGVDRFPAAYLDERAMEIRLLFDHREDLVAERTRMQNRLRWHLLELCPELEANLPRRSLSDLRRLERLDRRRRRLAPSVRLRVAREELAHIRALTRQANELESELLALINAYRPRLLQEQGCGTLTAALLIGRTAGAQRFRSDACFGRQSGTSPIPCSTGQRTQHRLDPGGDRQLNRALHTIAITRAHHDPVTREYLARKRAEGKTAKGALRSLKRYLARRVWRLLTEPPLAKQATPEQPAEPVFIPERPAPRRQVDRPITGPNPMVCIS
jgi:transposase